MVKYLSADHHWAQQARDTGGAFLKKGLGAISPDQDPETISRIFEFHGARGRGMHSLIALLPFESSRRTPAEVSFLFRLSMLWVLVRKCETRSR